MPKLKLLKGKESWTELTLESFPVLVGRDRRRCDVIFSDDTVSRQHAEIIRQGNKCLIVDRESLAGTSLNNQRLKPHCPYPLHTNDLIQICHYVLTFVDDAERDRGSDSVTIEEMDSSSFSSILESATGSWVTRKGINPEAKLTAIVELLQNLRGSESLDMLLERVLDSLLNLFNQAYRAVIVLTESRYKPSVNRYVRHTAGDEEETAVVSAGVIADVMAPAGVHAFGRSSDDVLATRRRLRRFPRCDPTGLPRPKTSVLVRGP